MAAQPDDAPRANRGDPLLRVGVATSLIASLSALALSVAAYRRSGEVNGNSPHQRASESAPASPRPPQVNLPAPLRPIPREADLPPSRAPTDALPPRLNRNNPGAVPSVPPSVAALATKLNLRSEALAPLLEDGGLPASAAARLEQAASAGRSLSQRLNYVGPQTEMPPNVLVAYMLRVLLAEREAQPGSVDPARIEELRAETLATLRAADPAGAENALREATRELDRLDATR
jgi:hypothetical protein